MKTLAAPATGSTCVGEASSRLAEPGDQLGAGGDDARLVGRAHHLVDRRARRDGSSTFQHRLARARRRAG